MVVFAAALVTVASAAFAGAFRAAVFSAAAFFVVVFFAVVFFAAVFSAGAARLAAGVEPGTAATSCVAVFFATMAAAPFHIL